MKAATESATTRRELVSAFEPLSLAANAAKYHAVYDRDLDANPYRRRDRLPFGRQHGVCTDLLSLGSTNGRLRIVGGDFAVC